MKSVGSALAGAFSSHALSSATADDSLSRARRPRGRRGQQAEADHKRALSQAWTYQQGRARSAADRAALDAEYERRMAEGPDFLRARSKSEFRDAPRHGLDREQLAKVKTLFFGMCNAEWKHRDGGRHRATISRTCESVMGAVIWLAGRFPRLYPSLECLARLARCCKQSVVTALATLERLGWITRYRRLQRRPGLLGPETVQATNGYQLHTPTKGWGLLGLLLFRQEPESNRSAANGYDLKKTTRPPLRIGHSPGVAPGDTYGEPPAAVRF